MSPAPHRIVCVHDGVFHADDVFAAATIAAIYGDRLQIVRSRRPEDWLRADYVIDVGARHEMDAEGRHWLDHHQPGGAGVRTCGVPYASFGLAWEAYGPEVVALLAGTQSGSTWVRARIDRDLVAPIDAADTGFPLFTGGTRTTDVGHLTVSALVDAFNPAWDAPKTIAPPGGVVPGPNDPVVLADVAFAAAVQWAKKVIQRAAERAAAEFRARFAVRTAYAARTERRVLVLPADMPWEETLLSSAELGDEEVLFVVYPDAGASGWIGRCVPHRPGGRDQRRPLPAAWAGLRDAALRELTGVPDAAFCHNARFCLGAATIGGVRRLLALAAPADAAPQ